MKRIRTTTFVVLNLSEIDLGEDELGKNDNSVLWSWETLV